MTLYGTTSLGVISEKSGLPRMTSAQRSPSTPRTGSRGVTFTVAVFVTPAYDASIVTALREETAPVVTWKKAEVAPAGTVTMPGAVATPGA